MNRHWSLALALLLATGTAGAVNLETVYEQALVADPTMQQAEALHMATKEQRTQAILDMLPLDTNVSKTWEGRNSNSTADANPRQPEPAGQPVFLGQVDRAQAGQQHRRPGRGQLPGRAARPDLARRAGIFRRARRQGRARGAG